VGGGGSGTTGWDRGDHLLRRLRFPVVAPFTGIGAFPDVVRWDHARVRLLCLAVPARSLQAGFDMHTSAAG